MTIAESMLDSDILSALLRKDRQVVERTQGYLESHRQLTFSGITKYEILRGLKAKRAAQQLARFDEFCETCLVLPISEDVIHLASDIYADLYRKGALIGDADILIAASAVHHNLTLVTNNESHFRRVTGLQVANWLSVP